MKNLLPLLLAFALTAKAETKPTSRNFLAREMTTADWSQATQPSGLEATIEFRQGDEIPIKFEAEGDFVESIQSTATYLRIKRNFWIRIKTSSIEMSLDGKIYKPLSEVAGGVLSAEAGNSPGVPVNAINILLKAYAK